MTLEKAWKLLNERGIFTMADYNKALEEAQIDIGAFTTPLEMSIDRNTNET